MTSKTVMIWHGDKETEASRGACIHFSTNLMEREPGSYILKNKAGEIVARIELMNGCRWRELATATEVAMLNNTFPKGSSS